MIFYCAINELFILRIVQLHNYDPDLCNWIARGGPLLGRVSVAREGRTR